MRGDTNWDKAIETTEALLANARAQKRALMQTLLAGHRRFPGFEAEPWREVRLGDVLFGKRRKGKVAETNFNREGVPYIGAASLSGIFNAFTNDSNAVLCDPADLLILWDGEKAGRTGVGLSGAVSSTVVQYRLKSLEIESRFLFYLTQRDRARIRASLEGSVIPHMPGDFELWYKFGLPGTAEQKKIVSAIDIPTRQLEDLTLQLDRLRTEKKALMQQPLTGQRRVVV